MKVLIERTGLSKGFNRYMVECELDWGWFVERIKFGF